MAQNARVASFSLDRNFASFFRVRVVPFWLRFVCTTSMAAATTGSVTGYDPVEAHWGIKFQPSARCTVDNTRMTWMA
ncbi:hypothetical protein WJX77_007754 [Trebouxia sp. C0004]